MVKSLSSYEGNRSVGEVPTHTFPFECPHSLYAQILQCPSGTANPEKSLAK